VACVHGQELKNACKSWIRASREHIMMGYDVFQKLRTSNLPVRNYDRNRHGIRMNGDHPS
jgi:hypothetical protein